jgi:hypothetical protein
MNISIVAHFVRAFHSHFEETALDQTTDAPHLSWTSTEQFLLFHAARNKWPKQSVHCIKMYLNVMRTSRA